MQPKTIAKLCLACLCLGAGLVAGGTQTWAQTLDQEEARSDALMCMGAYADVLGAVPDDARAKRGLLVTSDAYKTLTGKSDDEIANDAAVYGDTIAQLDKDGIQALSDVRDHCDALFMAGQPAARA